MSGRSLRIPVASLVGDTIELRDSGFHYLTRVHRTKVGDRVLAFCPEEAQEGTTVIEAIDARAVRLRVEERRPANRPARRAVVFQGLGKGDKMDAIVRDATELGATRIVPIITERTVARGASAHKVDRWKRIAIEAARQCGRSDVPLIDDPRALLSAIECYRDDLTCLCLHPEGTTNFVELVTQARSGALFAIGPEGGFSEAELLIFSHYKFHRVCLSAHILRTETACAAALGATGVLWDTQ